MCIRDRFPFVKEDIKNTLKVMDGLPVTIRTLDPPLHEFIPKNLEARERLAKELNITIEELNIRAEQLHENNPMMGHRGVRLGVSYPEITEMQVRAILELSLIHISEPTRLLSISYAVFCLKKKNTTSIKTPARIT